MISGIKNRFSIFNRKSNPNDIILTGVPRSGTTLICKLLCEVPNTIGLNEPLSPELFPDRKTALKSIDTSFHKFRKSLIKDGMAPVRTKDGAITDNAYSQTDKNQRKKVLVRTNTYFDKKLDKDFNLIMKHCAEFSLLFPELLDKYNCFASIRNPLALLGSWNSVNIPVSRGKVAKSRKIHPSFYNDFGQIDDLYDRQLFILDWYFGQFHKIQNDRIIRYEEIASSNGGVLSNIVQEPVNFDLNIQNKNFSKLYNKNTLILLGQKLLDSDGSYWKYYSKSDVKTLLNQYEEGE